MKNVKNIIILGCLIVTLSPNLASAHSEMKTLQFTCGWRGEFLYGNFEITYDTSKPQYGNIKVLPLTFVNSEIEEYSGCDIVWSTNSKYALPLSFTCKNWLNYKGITFTTSPTTPYYLYQFNRLNYVDSFMEDSRIEEEFKSQNCYERWSL